MTNDLQNFARVQQSSTQLGRDPMPEPTVDPTLDNYVRTASGDESWSPQSTRETEPEAAP